jgi:site-specific DNA-cytosine methylase
MRVLVACEESQAVTKELRRLGHEAYSCDVQECSGGHPEWHLQQDVIPLLAEPWDMIIAFPPCTDLAVSGARHFAKKRADGRQQRSIEFFMRFANVDCPKVAIENPIGIMSSHYRKPDQIIQPYQFGDHARKSTCLWLKNLPPLKPTNVVEPELVTYICKSGKKVTFGTNMVRGLKERAKDRSKTFHGVAVAMAEQWTENMAK